ncbi:MAG TPA: transposase, partial [Polyangiaceae bacterium]|nr:transposase [Polyangiaceae bacterium]
MADDVKDELKALVLRARQEKQGPFPETLRQRLIRYAVERWKAGVSVRTVAAELGVSGHTLSYWKAQAIHIADEADKVCSACGGDLREWTGQFEESEEIDIVERRFVIKKHKRQ